MQHHRQQLGGSVTLLGSAGGSGCLRRRGGGRSRSHPVVPCLQQGGAHHVVPPKVLGRARDGSAQDEQRGGVGHVRQLARPSRPRVVRERDREHCVLGAQGSLGRVARERAAQRRLG